MLCSWQSIAVRRGPNMLPAGEARSIFGLLTTAMLLDSSQERSIQYGGQFVTRGCGRGP